MKALLVSAGVISLTTGALFCDDFRTLDGKEYKNATVSRTEPDGIVVVTNSGIIKLYFSELPQDVRAKYNYDPGKAREFSATDARKQQILYEQQQRDRATIAQQQATSAPMEENKQPTTNKVAKHDNVSAGTALDKRPSGPKWFMQGHVVQVIEGEGILLHTVKSNRVGLPEPKDGSLVFVAGRFDPTLDWNDALAMNALGTGTYRYTTVQGASKTVAAYQLLDTLTPVTPFVYDGTSHRYVEQ